MSAPPISGRSWRRRRRAGRFMRAIAALGVVFSIGGAIAGWHLLGQIDATLSDSLEITGESLVTLEDTVELADEILGSVDEALVATERSLRAVVESTDDAVAVIGVVDELVVDVVPSLTSIESTLRDLAGVGATIDGVLEQLDDIPFGPNYDPDQPLGAQIEVLADDISPVVDSLASASGPLSGLASASAGLETEIDALADSIGTVNAQLQLSATLLDSYLATAQRAQSLAVEADEDLGGEVGRTRIFLVLVAVLVAAGQIVPWWVGGELLERAALDRPSAGVDARVRSPGRDGPGT